MASALKSVTNITSPQNLLSGIVSTSPLVIDGITASSNEVEIHGSWQRTGLPVYSNTGEGSYPGQRLRLGTNITSYVIKDAGNKNGAVLAVEVDTLVPTWKPDLKQSLLALQMRLGTLIEGFDVMSTKIIAAAATADGVIQMSDAIQGWADGNATMIPD